MSKLLAELLGITDPLFAAGLKDLERATGDMGVDVRLSAEIIEKVHQKTRELGLDPNDTTTKEVYYALLNLAKTHDAFLAKRLGARDPSDAADVLARLTHFVSELDVPSSVWVLKHSVARRLLKATPPKRLMKQLGYRSLDSMIKRESMAELFIGLRLVESEAWLQNFIRKYKALTPGDFESRDIELIRLDAKKWDKAAEKYVKREHHNLAYLYELGVVAVLPLPVTRMPGLAITSLPLVLHYMGELRVYSAYFKLQQVKPEFGQVLVETLLNDPGNHVTIAGHQLHWRTLHKHFAEADMHPEMFEPHVQPEDLTNRKAEEVLYRLEPALHFWHGMDFVGVRSEPRPISFNLTDMAVSYLNGLHFGHHAVGHFRESLLSEMYLRYLRQPILEVQVLRQLDNRSFEPELEIPSFEGVMA